MKEYSTVLFDFDGTLLQSGPAIFATLREMLREMGLPPRADAELYPMVGPPLREGFMRHLGIPEAQVMRALELYRAKAPAVEAALGVQTFAGVPALLRALRAAGKQTAMVTAKLRATTERHVVSCGLEGRLDMVFAAENNLHCDKAGMIVEAMAALHASPKTTVMVGDRVYDIEAANRAGVDSIGVLYGYGSRGELMAAGATYLVNTVEELMQFLINKEGNAI
ncbi:MAG: HAD hydrolase-like protein [Christensenellaceae bacterium]|jgi:phosphoglycolate phosphatase|nr:HAD hydrolase-like protein [Christensenellaceae bacterium]